MFSFNVKPRYSVAVGNNRQTTHALDSPFVSIWSIPRAVGSSVRWFCFPKALGPWSCSTRPSRPTVWRKWRTKTVCCIWNKQRSAYVVNNNSNRVWNGYDIREGEYGTFADNCSMDVGLIGKVWFKIVFYLILLTVERNNEFFHTVFGDYSNS